MKGSTRQQAFDGLEAVRTLVYDHGDAFRLSISKRGRVWATLTHWDTEKYNTSVELDAMGGVPELLNAFFILATAHHLKCFGGRAHTDSWTGIDLDDVLLADCVDYVNTTILRKAPNVDHKGPDDAS